jgi:toxin ParE1/3/4
MIVRFSPRAARDLSDIADYIRSRNPSGAQRVRAAILTSVEILARFPDAGRLQSYKNVRKLVVRRYPYLIYYTVDFGRERTGHPRHPACRQGARIR